MSERQSMKPVLKQIGDGQFEVMCDRQDFNVQTFQTPDGKQTSIPAPSLISFMAVRCHEMGESDIWAFHVPVQTQAGAVTSLIYLRGSDIYMVKALSKVAL